MTPTLSVEAFHANETELQVRLLTRGLAGTVGGVVSLPPNEVRHFWLPPPVHVQVWTLVPRAVLPPVTSRQSPDWTPTMVWSALTRHFWLGPPVQV